MLKGVTGWSIGDANENDTASEALSLYTKLENVILPLYYREPDRLSK